MCLRVRGSCEELHFIIFVAVLKDDTSQYSLSLCRGDGSPLSGARNRLNSASIPPAFRQYPQWLVEYLRNKPFAKAGGRTDFFFPRAKFFSESRYTFKIARKGQISNPITNTMKRTLILAVGLLVFHGAILAGEILAAGDLKPEKTWQGAVQLSLMLEPGKGIRSGEKFEPLTVIQTSEAFKSFLGELPEKQITPTNPAPPNDDPLLKAEIDFNNHTLIVLRAGNLDGLEIKNIAEGDDNITLTIEYLPELSARPIGTGSYTAVLLPKTKKQVKIVTAK